MNARIIHGTMTSPEGSWYASVSGQLGALGIESKVPTLPTPEHQSLRSWFKAFEDQCGNLNSGSAIVGHSCGATFALRLVERLERPIACTILVAPVSGVLGLPEYDVLNSSFLESPFDWERIKNNAGKLFVLFSDHDPYIPQMQLQTLAEDLGVEPTIIKGGGHLNGEAGYTTFPLLVELVEGVLTENKLTNQGNGSPKATVG